MMFEYNGKKPTNPQETLVYWIQERERIRILKESCAAKPWSDDPVFQRTYFCNVRREDDRVTKWIRSNWSPELIGWDDYEYAMVVARFLNWPPTLAAITEAGLHKQLWDNKELFWLLDGLAKKGKVWGNAYVITTHGIPMPKATYLCERVLPAAYELLGAGRWRGAYGGGGNYLWVRHAVLMRLEGLGSFLAAQVIADLKNTEEHPLYDAVDWLSWSAPGPGSMRGLGWFHGVEGGVTPVCYAMDMLKVNKYIKEEHPETHKLYQGNMQDLQNCLCEYDKYMRVSNGTGRSKRNYPGT